MGGTSGDHERELLAPSCHCLAARSGVAFFYLVIIKSMTHMSKRRVQIFAFSLQKNQWKSEKEKNCLEERNDECDRRGGKSSSFIVKKARI
jgi:hypothetical protein